MNSLRLDQVSKRYKKHWIFRNLSLKLQLGESLYVSGPNGSGKSTLLKLMSGWISPNEGKIEYIDQNQRIVDVQQVFNHIAICTPYFELIEEFNLDEFLSFHRNFKTLNGVETTSDFANKIEIEYNPNKPIKSYSSGMKQRIKLGLALYSNAKLVLLDEPTSNLDKNGIEWYKNSVLNQQEERMIVVCSNNIEAEHFFCTKKIDITDFK